MWGTITKFILEQLGVPGLLIIALGFALFVVWRRYEKLVVSAQEQAEKCRRCKEESEVRHDHDMEEYYNTMRDENHKLWDRMEKTLNRLADGLAPLANKVSELSGKLNGIGRSQ